MIYMDFNCPFFMDLFSWLFFAVCNMVRDH